jgi:phosphoribosylglycinamide formyltransferase 1
MKQFRIALFASGNGTNAEVIMAAFQKHPSIEVALVLSNNADAFVLKRAQAHNIPTRIFTRTQFRESDTVIQWLQESNITHIVLAGFMWLVPDSLTKRYSGKIVNIHPALLPKFGGKGMYGMFVHEAVKAAGETETGITIHEVNEHYDEGKVLFQATCEVAATDTVEMIAHRVQQLEHLHYPKVIEQWVLKGWGVRIK